MKSSAYALVFLCLAVVKLAGALSDHQTGSKLGNLQERRATKCGPNIGRCGKGECCSDAGYCGTSKEYCEGSQCQLDYSDSCATFFGPPGDNTEDIPRPLLGAVPYGTLISKCRNPGLMALTYDDGPWEYTTELLDILEKHSVKATFFISGDNRGKGRIDDRSTPWPPILKRMHEAGHHLASHTWTHRNLNEVNYTIQRSEIIYNEMAFRNIFGWFPTYMRPPYLECNQESGCIQVMESLGYHVITVNIDTKDYENDDPELIENSERRFSANVSSNPLSNGYIALAHDVHYQTVANLTEYMVKLSKDRGYKLVTVGECLGDPKENWYRSGIPDAFTVSKVATTTPSSKVSETTATSSYAKPKATSIISKDQRCGGDEGHTCKGSAFGNCCSFYGYCGKGAEYCGTGCDPDFGECYHVLAGMRKTTNGLCGDFFRSTCAGYGDKTCCSQYGYCSSSEQHCGEGCQKGYGNCL